MMGWGETRVRCDSALKATSFGISRMDSWKVEKEWLVVWLGDSSCRNGYWEGKHVPGDGGWARICMCVSVPCLWSLTEAVWLYFLSHQRNAGWDSCSVSLTCHHHTDTISTFHFPLSQGISQFLWLWEEIAKFVQAVFFFWLYFKLKQV